ncbi:MAG: sigma-70 family RNA polymerase sigma factor [Bacilli bacterium]|nr:sigma-70 family RNA polymerase sigma factor [Bacilli bacterium]MBR6865844.1 sigma-70 family RNA polymerase sigma factor [Bacilli bacterium]
MKDEIIVRREEVIELFDAYGELLTKTQQDLFKEYYLYDLSLSEIAEDRGISRSAVNDTLKKAIAKLEELESKIKLIKIKKSLQKRIEKLEKANENEKEEALDSLKEYINGI